MIEKTQAQINKLKDLKTGMMQELLTRGVGVDEKPHTEFKDSPVGRIPKGWEVDTFDNVFTLKNGVNKGKEFFGQGVPIISYRNVYDGNGIYDGMLTNRVEMTEGELSRFKVNLGDIFITRTSETADEIGFTNVYLGSLDNVVYNGFVIRARQKRKIFDINYCKYAFQANYMRQQMIHSSKFTTRAGISGESLNLLKIIIPPLSEQKAIGDTLSAVDGRIQTLMKIKTSKVSLKKALMQDLLTGKVRVKVDSE
ncbi:restriction endonuclease subunit S [Aliivibrio sifiae]|nr:restriction endonuclease subunit S [Aliivibrio sifiae]